MDVALILDAAIYSLIGVTALSLVRVVIGPEPEDRMIGLNLTASQVLAILVLAALKLDRAIFLDVALVYAILGFIGMLAIARALWRKEQPS
ncbi:MAG: pH regulation protein F [Spirochaetaceae bacterium]|nr:MAG: pH regulation protein F [Spirochaetaceae bacterium]